MTPKQEAILDVGSRLIGAGLTVWLLHSYLEAPLWAAVTIGAFTLELAVIKGYLKLIAKALIR